MPFEDTMIEGTMLLTSVGDVTLGEMATLDDAATASDDTAGDCTVD